MRDKIEFYLGDSIQPFLIMESSFQPNEGDVVSILGVTYDVLGRSFSVDHADKYAERSIRCNVIVEVAAASKSSAEGE